MSHDEAVGMEAVERHPQNELAASRGLRALVGGWQAGGVYLLQSGQFVTRSWTGPGPVCIAYTTSRRPAQQPVAKALNAASRGLGSKFRLPRSLNINKIAGRKFVACPRIALPPTSATGCQVTPRLNHLRDANLTADQRSPNRWFDVGAFSPPAPGFFGTAANGVIKGPGTNVWHAGLVKYFNLPEPLRLRWEISGTNVFNHPNWANPGTNISSLGGCYQQCGQQ